MTSKRTISILATWCSAQKPLLRSITSVYVFYYYVNGSSGLAVVRLVHETWHETWQVRSGKVGIRVPSHAAKPMLGVIFSTKQAIERPAPGEVGSSRRGTRHRSSHKAKVIVSEPWEHSCFDRSSKTKSRTSIERLSCATTTKSFRHSVQTDFSSAAGSPYR